MAVIHKLARLRPVAGESKAKDNVIQPGFKSLEQGQTGQTRAALREAKITPELTLINSINPAGFLFCPQLASIIRFALHAALPSTAMLAGGKTTVLKRAFRAVTSLALLK
jgi:hypothetical protein